MVPPVLIALWRRREHGDADTDPIGESLTSGDEALDGNGASKGTGLRNGDPRYSRGSERCDGEDSTARADHHPGLVEEVVPNGSCSGIDSTLRACADAT